MMRSVVVRITMAGFVFALIVLNSHAAGGVAIVKGKWHINGMITHPGAKGSCEKIQNWLLPAKSVRRSARSTRWNARSARVFGCRFGAVIHKDCPDSIFSQLQAEGLLMNVRMVNATFEDANDKTRPKEFDPDANTDRFIKQIPDYLSHGVRAFTLNLQGGACGYEGAINSAFNPDGSLRASYLKRVRRVIEACDRNGAVVILGCGKHYDQFAIEALFKPLGIEHWWFEKGDPGGEKYGEHPGQHIGVPARDLARIPYCMMHNGRWGERQVIPRWFVKETAAPTHKVEARELRWGYNADCYSHAWELPARLRGENANHRKAGGIPADARYKPGSGGQIMAFVPRLNLVITRQTGSSGQRQYDEYLRRACAAVLPQTKAAKPFTWETATPESQGMSGEKLDALKAELAKRKTRAFLVIRNDKIVYEWYADGNDATKKQGTASLAKAIVGGLSLGVAITDGTISLDDKAAKYVPPWKDDPKKSRITIRHLGSHTSGLEDAEANRLPHDKLTGWKGDFWKRLDPPNDPFTIARDQTPILFDPGSKLSYSNPGIAMLDYCIAASLKDGPWKDIRTLLRQRVLKPIGVPDAEWSAGYGKTFTVNALPLAGSWGGGSFTPRAAARIGRLLLREGDWDGKQILSKDAVRQIAGDAGLPGHCGMGFWTNADGRYPQLPKDTYYGAGAGDQLLIVVPSLNLIVVRNGETLAPAPKNPNDVFEAYHSQRVKILFEPVVSAITDRPKQSSAAPYPPSKVIGVEWAPKETIIRKAKGSDNWPMTWADDDHLYTAYGDGNGFEPFVSEKLSLGIARVEGTADKFASVNIRAKTVESRGEGKEGTKASGMLCVDKVLYLWVRNAANARLAWSTDHGQTWEWSDWKFMTSFGCPTFLNFGKDYAGARDEFVYIYSHDADSAYSPADRMVLARVPKGRIRQRDAYEFYKGLDEKNRPLWSEDIAKRGAVFCHPGKCYRSGITYNAALKRYFWSQTLPGNDPRFKGGFGIYDAPEPWGPWTTVFYTDAWDVGPGETASFPTKWISTDGKTLHLVFSGDDYFSVRKASLTLRKHTP